MGSLEQEGEKMIQELRRLWAAPFTWLLVLGPTALNGVLALFQRRYGPERYWSFVGQFWDKLGLGAVAVLVLSVCLSLVSCDKTCRTEDLMLTTRLGRKSLFLRRLLACALGVLLFALLLSAGNFLCGLTLAGGLSIPDGWAVRYLGHTLLAGAGGALLALSTCGLCEIFRSLPVAFLLVAVVLLFSALAPDLKGEPLDLYVLANGFFAKLIRGRALTGWTSYSPPWGYEWWLWGPWHLCLPALCVGWAVRKRKERNQW